MQRQKQKNSLAWDHFISLDNGRKATCKYCNKTSVISNGSTGNLFRHLRMKHSDIPIDRTKKPVNETHLISNDSDYAVVPVEINKSVNEVFHPTVVHCTSVADVEKSDSVSEEPGQQPVAFYLIQPFDENKRQEVDRQLLKIIVKNLYHFSIVEDQEFIKFISMLNPSYVLPSRKALSDDTLSHLYQSTINELKSAINDVTAVALTTDRWMSVNNENFIAVTAHYLNKNLQLKSSLLDIASSHLQFNSSSIALFLQEFTVNWGLSNKILAVITDGTDDMIKAVDNCQWSHIPCFVHILNQVVEAGLAEINPFIVKVRNIVQYFRRNSVALNKLHIIQNQMGLSNSNIKKDVPSRWHTTFDMLTRFLKNKVPLLSATEQLQLHSLQLSSAEFLYLENIIKVLIIFNSIRVEICSEKTISLSKIPYMVTFMSTRLTSLLEHTELHPEIVNMANKLKEELKKFEALQTNDIVCQSVLLDPRFKKRGLPDKYFEEAYSSLRLKVTSVREEIMKEKNLELLNSSQSKESRVQSEYFMDMWSEFDDKDPPPQRNLTESAAVEVDAFLNDEYLDMENNPLTYWASISNQNKFPALFELAKRTLCIPAASVPCERMYSKAGNIFIVKRNHLNSTKVKKILFLHHNL